MSAAPTRQDGVVAAASEVIGGPLGRFATIGRRGWQPVAALLMALASVFLAGGVLEKAHCLMRGWSGTDQFWHACYSDLPVVYTTSGLSKGVTPYLPGVGEHALAQPIVTGLTMWGLGDLVPGGSGVLRQQQWYFALWAGLLVILLTLLVLVTAATVSDVPWRAAHVALSPLLVTVALVSADLLGMLLASAGLWAWSKRRDVPAGILLGLAILARSYPVLIALAMVLVALRGGQRQRAALVAGATAGTVAVVSIPWLVADSGGFLTAYSSWWTSTAGYGSPWLIPQLLGHALPTGVVTLLALLGWGAAVLVGTRLAFSEGPSDVGAGARQRSGDVGGAARQRSPGVVPVAAVMIAIVLVTGKSIPVQSSLWLLPLVALAGVKWRDHLIWAGMECVYFIAVWIYAPIGQDPNRAIPAHVYAIFLLARLLAIGWIAGAIWWTVPWSRDFGSEQVDRYPRAGSPDSPVDNAEPVGSA